jgi:hypothetical protein
MTLSDRAAAAAPYAQQLLNDRDVQDAIRRAFEATRGVYAGGRGKRAGQAVNDKKLRRQLQQAVTAVGELASALSAPKPQRKPSRRGKVAALAAVSAAAFFVLNADARELVLARLAGNDAKPTAASQ